MTIISKLYFKIDDILSKDACELLAGALLLCEQQADPNGLEFQDKQVMGSYSRFDYSGTDSLKYYLLPKMEQLTGKRLIPTYSYSRIYRNGHDLFRHVDKPRCEYSITITLKDDGTPWPIIMGDHQVDLPQGSGCVYMGEKIPHERKPYTGQQHVQVFCHYVDADGPYNNKADPDQFNPF